MSNIYIQEPPTNGKVLLKTSLGDIDIELWSKEAPKACRNFVQLCMEGYYHNTIFHRVVKGFIAQGGDPTGTGTGGESIYGKPFKDEFHQRLKFNRRGLVAMANAGADDNGSQFFFTLDRADELNKKHTIFGKVTGNTIYNMIRFNDLDISDADDRPYAPPKIIKTEVLSNPFDDIQARKTKKQLEEEEQEKQKGKIKSKSKATKNYKLLSFGEEAEEDEDEADQFTKEHHIKSSHDVLNDPKLSSQPAIDPTEKRKNENSEVSDSIRKKLKKDEKEIIQKEEELEDIEDKKKKERRRALQEEAKKLKRELKAKDKIEVDKKEEVEKPEKEPVNDLMRTLLDERKTFIEKKKENVLLKKGGNRESQTLELLAGFEQKLSNMIAAEPPSDSKQKETKKDNDKEDDENDEGWMSHKLDFESEEKAKDANMKGDDWYDIHDPRNPINKRKREKSKKDHKEKR
ncbi:spliceosome-associated protein CWC27 homolog [Hydractinia symbiolongicarpus]|uniref:spliceosome-associated protein CWC27 homolog n=1 Tax=Hydractinia symbiolongicarpus TaxID=13093 RepID=UPI00255025EA|nr:spliceosome-associated protein CWC27 homolog [Hydractinia symbiolongicarpus]XP_057298579.1 spliceosome-associated protein CWC27 homolog [Hydractinia symbiolongicarpus]